MNKQYYDEWLIIFNMNKWRFYQILNISLSFVSPRHAYILLTASQRSVSVTSAHAVTLSWIAWNFLLSSPYSSFTFDKIKSTSNLLFFNYFKNGEIVFNKIIYSIKKIVVLLISSEKIVHTTPPFSKIQARIHLPE